MDPYVGDQFHEPPYNLVFYQQIINYIPAHSIPFFFIVCDMITTILIFISSRAYLQKSYIRQCDMFKQHVKEEEQGNLEVMTEYRRSNVFLTMNNVEKYASYCALLYLFNPFSILNCVAQTTTVILNIVIAGLLFALIHGKYVKSIYFNKFIIN